MALLWHVYISTVEQSVSGFMQIILKQLQSLVFFLEKLMRLFVVYGYVTVWSPSTQYRSTSISSLSLNCFQILFANVQPKGGTARLSDHLVRLTVMNCALCILNTALLWENSSKLSASSRVRWANIQTGCCLCGTLPPSRARHEPTFRWRPHALLYIVSWWIFY